MGVYKAIRQCLSCFIQHPMGGIMNIKRSLACVFAILVVCGSLGSPVKAAPSSEGESPTATGDEFWDNQFLLGVYYSPQPTNSSVFAIAVSGSDVYVGGDFTVAGNVAANRIAKWDSSANRWSALGSGLNSRVLAIAARGDDVYVGGNFTQAGGASIKYIAHWNDATQTWSALGSELTHAITSPEVDAIAIAANGDVYVGGEFDTAGGVTANNIARWDGSAWHSMGTGVAGTYHSVNAIAISGNDVYVGGSFTTAGGNPASRVAKWNGSSWSPLLGGANDEVDAIAIVGTSVYIAGTFDSVHDTSDHPAGHVAMWTGGVWNTLNGGVGAPDAYALAVGPDNKVYLGGRFTTLADGSTSARRLAKWDGSAWTPVGGVMPGSDGVDSNLYALAFLGDQLYMGGFFRKSNEGKTLNYIGYWDISDGEWYGLGNSVDAPVYATTVIGDYVYVGGVFTSAGGVKSSRLARWNQHTGQWSDVGGGVSGCRGLLCSPVVYAMAVDGENLYVGGNFTHAGVISASGVARWNTRTQTWSALGEGVSCSGMLCTASVRALAVAGGKLYAGGNFDYAGGSLNQANNISVWDGNGWGVFGNGTNNTVYAVAATSTSNVFIGGSFTSPENHVARWTGSWNPLTSGVNSTVYATTKIFNASWIYLGGAFTDAGGVVAADHIAIFGIGWGALGAGLDNTVNALYRMDDGSLYAGGDFTISGITGLNHIGRWYSTSWSSLGSGTDDAVNALAYDNGKVYVGGDFLNAGGKPSAFFGRSGPYLVRLPVVIR
jgi:hypothetical protein